MVGATLVLWTYCYGAGKQPITKQNEVEWRGAFSLLLSDDTSQWFNLDFENEADQTFEIVLDDRKIIGILLHQVTTTTQPQVQVLSSDVTTPYNQQPGKNLNSRALILHTPVSCSQESPVELEIRFARPKGRGKLVRFQLKTPSSWLANNVYRPDY